jgi:hypothetical protein
MPSLAIRWRSRGTLRDHLHRVADAMQVAAQMAEPRSSVKQDNIHLEDEVWV